MPRASALAEGAAWGPQWPLVYGAQDAEEMLEALRAPAAEQEIFLAELDRKMERWVALQRCAACVAWI